MTDPLLVAAYLFFLLRGYLRGTTRALFSLVSAVGSAIVVSFFPNAFFFFTRYFFEHPHFESGTRLTSQLVGWLFFFGCFQVLGFAYTGVIESISLTQASKIGGLTIGLVTSVFVTCLPIVFIYSYPYLYWSQWRSLIGESSLLPHVQPMVSHLIKAPAKPKPTPGPTPIPWLGL